MARGTAVSCFQDNPSTDTDITEQYTWHMSYLTAQAQQKAANRQAARRRKHTFHARRVARSYDYIEALTREALCSRLPYALPCAAQEFLHATCACPGHKRIILAYPGLPNTKQQQVSSCKTHSLKPLT